MCIASIKKETLNLILPLLLILCFLFLITPTVFNFPYKVQIIGIQLYLYFGPHGGYCLCKATTLTLTPPRLTLQMCM